MDALGGVGADLLSLAQVVLIDVTLAGDNAVVVGLAVAGLPKRQRRLAILVGLAGAAVMRIALGAITVQLLAIVGLLLAGGLLLLWVVWKSFRELRHAPVAGKAAPRPCRPALGRTIGTSPAAALPAMSGGGTPRWTSARPCHQNIPADTISKAATAPSTIRFI